MPAAIGLVKERTKVREWESPVGGHTPVQARAPSIHSPAFLEDCISDLPQGYPRSSLAPLSVGVIPPAGHKERYDTGNLAEASHVWAGAGGRSRDIAVQVKVPVMEGSLSHHNNGRGKES